jgi:hypothetical protein
MLEARRRAVLGLADVHPDEVYLRDLLGANLHLPRVAAQFPSAADYLEAAFLLYKANVSAQLWNAFCEELRQRGPNCYPIMADLSSFVLLSSRTASVRLVRNSPAPLRWQDVSGEHAGGHFERGAGKEQKALVFLVALVGEVGRRQVTAFRACTLLRSQVRPVAELEGRYVHILSLELPPGFAEWYERCSPRPVFSLLFMPNPAMASYASTLAAVHDLVPWLAVFCEQCAYSGFLPAALTTDWCRVSRVAGASAHWTFAASGRAQRSHCYPCGQSSPGITGSAGLAAGPRCPAACAEGALPPVQPTPRNFSHPTPPPLQLCVRQC